MQCWQMESKDRPIFREIHRTILNFIECDAGYLQLGFNPFTDGEEGDDGKEGTMNDECKEQKEGLEEREEELI